MLREEERRLRPLRAEPLDEAVDVEALSGVAGLDAEKRPRDPLAGADQPRVLGMEDQEGGCEED